MPGNSDEKLNKAAKLYAKKEGESILAEADEIRRQNVSYLTPRADRTVRQLIAQKEKPKRRKALLGILAAAACIAITIRLVSSMPDIGGGSGMADSSSAPAAPSAPSEPSGWPPEILPITFSLPADYKVTKAEVDNGMSIYSLESETHGAVVLTMYYEERAAGSDEDLWEGFDEVIIDGTPVPAKVQSTYMLLAFEQDNLRYTISSENDLGSLAAFYRSIEKKV